MMTLEEAIKHAEEVAERLENSCKRDWMGEDDKRCAKEHRQLAEWLTELTERRKAEPQEGEWENITTCTAEEAGVDTLQQMRCSVCKRWHIVPYYYRITPSEYCPHCGAKMQAEPSGGSGNSPKYAER